MNDDNFKERVYLEAKESFFVRFLLIVAIIAFIIPIVSCNYTVLNIF